MAFAHVLDNLSDEVDVEGRFRENEECDGAVEKGWVFHEVCHEPEPGLAVGHWESLDDVMVRLGWWTGGTFLGRNLIQTLQTFERRLNGEVVEEVTSMSI